MSISRKIKALTVAASVLLGGGVPVGVGIHSASVAHAAIGTIVSKAHTKSVKFKNGSTPDSYRVIVKDKKTGKKKTITVSRAQFEKVKVGELFKK